MTHTELKGPWEINWFICRADQADVDHAKSNGEKMKIGDELWRTCRSFGPISVEHDHWSGNYLSGTEEEITLAASAPELLQALKDFAEIAAQAKPNCGPKLRALIQSAQEKHSAIIEKLTTTDKETK